MYEPALKCENNAIFKQNYFLELFIALKMAYCCCLGLRGNLDFPDFLQKKFHNIYYWWALFVYICHFLIPTTNTDTISTVQIEISVDGVPRIRTWGRIWKALTDKLSIGGCLETSGTALFADFCEF